MNEKKLTKLETIYLQPEKSAELIGLIHVDPDDVDGYGRKKHGKEFTYSTINGKELTAEKTIKRITDLAIPPAWTEVWIAPNDAYHVQAVGRDEAGRRQYIYHPQWRESRNVINFYRLILFGNALPSLRYQLKKYLKDTSLSKNYVIALALSLIDETAIRVGHETYFEEHESVGLTTLRKEHMKVTADKVVLSFTGKSGVDQIIIITKKPLVEALNAAANLPGEHVLQYRVDAQTYSPLNADDINTFLETHTPYHVSAKDFRTWHGTLACFKNSAKNIDKKITKKLVKAMVEDAAELLGNTPTVARKHYIHSDLLTSIQDEMFADYYEQCKDCSHKRGLSKTENQLLAYLELLFEEDFTLFSKQ